MEQISMNQTGSTLKIAGMERTLESADNACPNWTGATLTGLKLFCEKLKSSGRTEFVMEEFRATYCGALPPSCKAWGALANQAAKHGIICWTGRYQRAKSLRTHGHDVKIWVVTA